MGVLFQGGGLFCVGFKLSSQTKANCYHCVESWVSPPHGCEYMPEGADVLLRASLVDGLVVVCKDACADLVRIDL